VGVVAGVERKARVDVVVVDDGVSVSVVGCRSRSTATLNQRYTLI
jgi:hypothetical protein